MKEKIEKIKSGEVKTVSPEKSAMLPPIEQSQSQMQVVNNDDYYKEIYSKHVDIIEHLEKKLGNLKKLNESPQKRYKQVRELIPYEQLFEYAVENCKNMIKMRKSSSVPRLSTKRIKEEAPVKDDSISRTDKVYVD